LAVGTLVSVSQLGGDAMPAAGTAAPMHNAPATSSESVCLRRITCFSFRFFAFAASATALQPTLSREQGVAVNDLLKTRDHSVDDPYRFGEPLASGR